MRKYAEEHSPLRRNASGADVGELAAFLASNAASSITGQTLYGTVCGVEFSSFRFGHADVSTFVAVDGGLSIMAPYAKGPEHPHA
jgi:NAD(P)-dependent dehydrogenase (short-subunit alcohol dehydrogenase family)